VPSLSEDAAVGVNAPVPVLIVVVEKLNPPIGVEDLMTVSVTDDEVAG
jgi:hypothetical protein